jgi:large subunit ribosomal protein L15
MKLNEVRPARGAVRERKRIGRGPGSGRGGTAGKGHKGEQARSGSPKRKAFEGGQVRITRRLPKFGFKNPFRIEYQVVNVKRLQERFADGDNVDVEALIARGLLSKRFEAVKVLGDGDLSKKLSVRVDAVSDTARQKIEAAGGRVEIVEAGKLAKRADMRRQQAAAKATA